MSSFDARTALDVDGEDVRGVRWSIAIDDAATGERIWSHDADRVQRTASVGKIFLLVEIARQVEAGQLSLDEHVQRLPDEMVADSGIWHVLAADDLSIGDACALIGAVSDNLATNVLVRRIGLETIARTTSALGFAHSALLDRVREERLPQHPPTLSRGNADELAALMGRLVRGEIVSAPVSERVLGWLALNTDLSMVAQPFGFDPLAHQESDRGIQLWNKTGTISIARIDVGAVASARRRISWAVLADWGRNEPGAADRPHGAATPADDPRDAVLARMAAIGRRIREEVAR